MKDDKPTTLISEIEKEFDEKFPLKNGALTFSGKRAKAFLATVVQRVWEEGYNAALKKAERELYKTHKSVGLWPKL